MESQKGHTSLHNYDADGRDRQIEEYIRHSVDFALLNCAPYSTMLDLGCDYGYAMYYAKSCSLEIRDLIGVDLYYKSNPFNLDIRRESLIDPLLLSKLGIYRPDVFIFLNHSLEHLHDPYSLMRNLDPFKRRSNLFVAVPHCDSPWALEPGHYTIWNEKWLTHFMEMFGWKCVNVDTREFRLGHVEIWGVFT